MCWPKSRAIAGEPTIRDPGLAHGPESRFTAGDAWHHDVSCDATPIAPRSCVSQAARGRRRRYAFANMILAYESLSAPYKQFLDGLTAVHDGSLAWTAGYGSKPSPARCSRPTSTSGRAPSASGASSCSSTRPSLRTSCNSAATRARPVLQQLFRHIEKHLAFQVRVHWSRTRCCIGTTGPPNTMRCGTISRRSAGRAGVGVPGPRPKALRHPRRKAHEHMRFASFPTPGDGLG